MKAADESALATDDTTEVSRVRLHASIAIVHDGVGTAMVNANRCQREHYQATGAMRRHMVVGNLVSIHNHLPSVAFD
jgi:hypothetical protein